MKIDTRNYNEVYFASDFHWHHDRDFVWGKRGFDSVFDHDMSLRSALSVIRPDDLLVFHGDLALNCTQEEAVALLLSIPCNIIYILGNHDQRVERFVRDKATLCRWGFVFERIQFFKGIREITWVLKGGKKQPISHSHFPMMEWNRMNHGAWNLCGHVHGGLGEITASSKNDKALDLGVESTGKWLLSLGELCSIMDKKEICKRHHDDD